MSLRKQSILAFAAVAIMSASGCELIAKVDRDKIPHGDTGGSGGAATTTSSSSSGTGGATSSTTSSSGTGGMGGATSSSSSGTGGMGGATSSSSSGTGGMGGATSSSGTGGATSSSGTGGTGGGTHCTTAADCPAPANECITATCTNGACGTSFVTAGTLTAQQIAGDCHHDECDGNGAISTVVDDNDLPDDTNPCTKDTCTNGTPGHTNEASGTVCGTDLICDGNGVCVGCTQASDCPGLDTECQTRTCTSGKCGFDYAPSGTVLTAQTPGDCKKSQCDGNGAIEDVADDTDKPVDNKECTDDVCNNGTASNPKVTAGTACTEDGGKKCDGNGACVECLLPIDCGTDTACKKFTCTLGVCGSNNMALGTVVANPTAGDCHSDQCDGNGGLTLNAVDNNDKPVDNKQCTNDVCTAGTPSNPNVTAGTACSQNGGTKCDGNGACVQCITAADCGTDTACKTFTCNAGVCQQNNVTAGTAVGDPTAGDCHSNECDGNGNIVSAVNDNDKPVDGKQCTNDVCIAGVASNPPSSAGSSCSENGGTKCDGNGACVQCFVAADCGVDTACKKFTCNAGVCGSNNMALGTLVANPTPGDCRSDQCDGNGGITTNAVDNNDKPADDGNQCTNETCSAGMAVHPPKAAGTSCNQNGGSICDANGNCVTCSLDTDCPAGGACQAPKCNAGTCGFVAAPAGDLPPAAQTAGDCQKLACDGTSQTPVSVADNSDVPANDGNQCTNDTCSNGAPVHPNAAAGTSCNQNGGKICDANGACVQCLTAVDCPAGANACQVAVCNSGTCGFAAAAAGDLPAGQQTAGDCKKLTCDGTTQAPVSVADNSDLPADDGNQCTTEACNNGSPTHPNAASGTSCNQNGGTSCDGAGNCVAGTGLSVSSTTPADGGTAAATTTIAITFSQAVKPATLTGQTSLGACTGSIQVSANDFASCIGFSSAAPTMSGTNTIATFSAQPGLLINRTYKVRVTTAVQSAAGAALSAQYTSTNGFTTTNPLSSATGVVISQVFGGGGGSSPVPTYKSDYVVLHNRGTTAVDLTGWSVQYGSSGGTGNWTVGALATTANPNPSIAAGGYFLFQLSSGNTGAALPTPDSISATSIAMSASAGKVALVNNTTALNGACPTGASIVDVVGYGGSGTNCSEGTPVAALTSTTAAFRNVAGCTDTNANSADFTVGTPLARNSASPRFTCTPAQNESGSALEADFCATQFPLSLSVSAASMQTVYGRIYNLGTTDQGMNPPSGVTAQLGYGPTTANPEYEFGWTWIAASHNASCVDANPNGSESLCGQEDEFQATFTAPAAGTYRYGYRFSLDGGATWTYCDNRQGDNGAGANSGLAFDLENLASLTTN